MKSKLSAISITCLIAMIAGVPSANARNMSLACVAVDGNQPFAGEIVIAENLPGTPPLERQRFMVRETTDFKFEVVHKPPRDFEDDTLHLSIASKTDKGVFFAASGKMAKNKDVAMAIGTRTNGEIRRLNFSCAFLAWHQQ